ncbi:LysR family transcriptional regulator [Ruminococcus sp. Marseille-P6503]|uniref:LysR family transcriptional regulator n=1 Tax=Ruminococcus sp. Marseille-P6503 TaxID=2364796 RepID=UPI000F543828|nr:LysR family transcriptional regulator [Ruminococcus sp. Marseille-P6503]
MTIQQLKYAVTAAEKGTMSEAAQSLFIAQPSLTNAIRDLEKELRITIFHRTNNGIIATNEGEEFLGYARQVLQQVGLIEEKYIDGKSRKQIFSVSAQHYSFAVNAFVDVIKTFGSQSYDFTLRETQTYEIIQDVSRLKSEVGILYLSRENENIISKIIAENGLAFEELFTATPHVFISYRHPLAQKEIVTLSDLADYPYLCFEQGDYNSFYFSEEILSSVPREMTIKVRDRATLFNLAVGLDGYTISTGIISHELNGENIIARPLDIDECIRVGTVTRKNMTLSRLGTAYMDALKNHI